MITARSALKAYLAIVVSFAALTFPINVWAASGSVETCQPNTSCKVGEFLYDDSYAPINTGTCSITSRDPSGTLVFDNVSMSSASDGWYSHDFTAPATEGLYRTQICCNTIKATFATTDVNTSSEQITVGKNIPTGNPIKFTSTATLPTGLVAGTRYFAINISSTVIKVASSASDAQSGTAIDLTTQGSGTHTVASDDYMCLDKTFEVKKQSSLDSTDVAGAVWNASKASYTTSGSFGESLQNIVPTANDIATATWSYSGRTLSSFGSLVTDIWSYSSRSLSTFGTLVADIWSNSSRSITSADLASGSLAKKSDIDDTRTDVAAVKTDVASVKSKADDTKSQADSINSKVEGIQSDISDLQDTVSNINDSTTTINNVNNVQNVTNEISNIQNVTNETRNLVDQLVNKPVVENGVDVTVGTSLDLQSKINSTNTVANALLTNTMYVKSKTAYVNTKWGSLKESEASQRLSELSKIIGGEQDKLAVNTIFGQTNWIKDSWDFQSAQNIYSQIRDIKSKLGSTQKELNINGKSATAYKNLNSLFASAGKLQTLIGAATDSSRDKSLFGDAKKINEQAIALNNQSKTINSLLKTWDTNNKVLGINTQSSVTGKKVANTDLVSEVNTLTKDVLTLNKIPKINLIGLTLLDKTTTERNIKNRVLSLNGVVNANKQFLAGKQDRAFAAFWLEEGSIIFKTLVTNPSQSISQTVPIKYYLPMEVKRESIIKVDNGLEVNFDAEKNQYFVTGKVTLAPGTTKTLSIEVDDAIYVIPQKEIDAMRKQAEELAKPLEKTSYFAQGVTLKSDIDVSLDKVEELQKNAVTPEGKIRGYRDAQIQMKSVYEEMDKLKELVTSASSVGTMFGFVGGAQVLAVWGLIIIMAAGFVFLALYMRTLRLKEAEMLNSAIDHNIPQETKRVAHDDISPRDSGFGKYAKYAVIFIIFGAIVAIISGTVVSRSMSETSVANKNTKEKEYALSVTKPAVKEKQTAVLGANTQKSEEKIRIIVPVDSVVTVQSGSNINTPILTTLTSSQEAVKIGMEENWVKVKVGSTTGWIDKDFIEEISQKQSSTDKQTDLGVITVIDTPTGFLRVRSNPNGTEIAKINPGDQFYLLDQMNGWNKIELPDGNFGWVSNQYVKEQQLAQGGL